MSKEGLKIEQQRRKAASLDEADVVEERVVDRSARPLHKQLEDEIREELAEQARKRAREEALAAALLARAKEQPPTSSSSSSLAACSIPGSESTTPHAQRTVPVGPHSAKQKRTFLSRHAQPVSYAADSRARDAPVALQRDSSHARCASIPRRRV